VGQTGHHYENNTRYNFLYQTVDVQTGELEVLSSLNGHFEAPNWHPDNYLILNSYGNYTSLIFNLRKYR
jgi:hypothetical protein